MIKQILMALPALAGVAAAFDDATWYFDGNLAIESSESTLASNPGTLNSGAATYVDTGLVIGDIVGNYELTVALDQAVTLDSEHWVKTGRTYWASGAGKLAIGANGTSFTLVAYVKFDSVVGEQLFFGVGPNNQNGLAFGLKDGKLDLLAKGAGGAHYVLTSTPTLETNTWYNLAVSYDASVGTADFYVNGDNAGSVTGLGSATFNVSGGSAALGSASHNSKQGDFAGQIAEFQILSGAKTQSEILQAAHLRIPKPATEPDPAMAPEPSTATLSLLALAGLVLRRRR